VVGLLVQLKLRLLRNALKSSGQARAAFILSTIVAGLVAVGVFVSLAALRGQEAAVQLTTVTFTTFAFGWLILPLLVFSLDSTLDPSTLALYPLRTRPLAVGLLAASCAGAWPVANVVAMLGAVVGLASGVLGVLFALVAVVLQVLFCIVLARCVTTSLAGLLRSRRGKDFAALLILPIFALYEVFVQVVPRMTAEGKITAKSFGGIDAWMRWTPPGLAAHAIRDASTGHALTGLLRLLLLAAIIVALGALWIRQLAEALVTVDTTTQAKSVNSTALPFANRGLSGTIAARHWVYQRREPGAKIFWGLTLIIVVASAASTLRTPAYMGGLIGGATFAAAFIGVFNGNAIGMTGPAFGFDAVALHGRASLRAYFGGINAATAMIALPLFAVLFFVMAVIAKHPEAVFLALAVYLGGFGGGIALADIFSVVLAYPVEKRPGNPTPRAAEGYKMQNVGTAFGSIFGTAILAAPLIVAVVLTGHVAAAVRMPALLAAGAVYGLVLAALGIRFAARLAQDRMPELAEIALRSRP
jgi:ABC-2 type transport system permease protein